MKRYRADECCKSGWEDAEFYLCSDVDKAPDPWPLVQELVEALRQAEWGGRELDLPCPVCGRPDMADHREDCALRNALARAEAALKRREGVGRG
jgi:hypothetical protein